MIEYYIINKKASFVLNYFPGLIFLNGFVVPFRIYSFLAAKYVRQMRQVFNNWQWWTSETISKE